LGFPLLARAWRGNFAAHLKLPAGYCRSLRPSHSPSRWLRLTVTKKEKWDADEWAGILVDLLALQWKPQERLEAKIQTHLDRFDEQRF
jgi:hypothetical protein